MAKTDLKRKYEELQSEIDSQNKRIKLLEIDVETLLGDNRFLIDKFENIQENVDRLQDHFENITYKFEKIEKTIKKPTLNLRRRKRKYIHQLTELDDDYNEYDNDDDDENDEPSSTSSHSTSELVETDTDTTNSKSNTDDDEQQPQPQQQLINYKSKNPHIITVSEILPVLMMASAAASQLNMHQDNDDNDEDDGSISPNSKKLNTDKLKIKNKKHFEEYIQELNTYFSNNNLRNVSNINLCIEHFKKQNITIKSKIHHLELCKSLLNNEYINTTSKDLKYFINLEIETKQNIVSSISNIAEYTDTKTPIIYDILQRNITIYQKHVILDKVKQLNKMSPHDGEYHKLKKWIDTVMAIPYNNIYKLNISLKTHSPFLINNYLYESRKTLDTVIHGQTKTKDHIIQIISKLISNPVKGGNVFAIYGPPGTGKTTIIKNGLAKALQMPFAFISLGGATDSSYLDGHNYTYEGSTNGRIVDVVIQSKCINPIFYFDELDKVSKTHRGDEIINLLIHLIDSSQNNHFQDKYLAGITLDLSQSIFVFSFNEISLINPILLDRMELIKVDGFNSDEKITIAKDYLLPEIMNNYSIPQGEILFPNEIIDYITTWGSTSSKEEGVRNIKRRIENIISKLNVFLISGFMENSNMRNEVSTQIHSNIPDFIKEIGKTRPITITREIVDILVNTSNHINKEPPFGMYL